jgi:hypothetical protein
MNLLGTILYDPAAAASKATSSLLAMTALDTTNLRQTVTVPSHGKLRFHMRGIVTGATTTPTLLIGVQVAGVNKGRVAPTYENATANATTQNFVFDADFTVTGLAAGSTVFDAAYAVQVVVASTNIKFGGPDNASGANAWGGFLFEIWDPQPMQTNGQLVIDANGRVDVSKISGTTQTARDIGANVLLSPGTGTGQVDITAGVIKSNLSQILGTALTETSGQISAAFKKLFNVATPTAQADNLPLNTDYTAARATKIDNLSGDAYARLGAPAGASVSADVASIKTDTGTTIPGRLPAALGANGNIKADVRDLLGTAWLTPATAGTPDVNAKQIGATAQTGRDIGASVLVGDKTGFSLSAAGVQAIWDALTSAFTTAGSIGKKLADWVIGTTQTGDSYARLGAPAGASVSADIAAAKVDTAAIKVKTDNLPASPAATSDVTTVGTNVSAIKTQTDKLAFTVANQLDANIQSINDAAVAGDGTSGNKWRAA